MIIWGWKVRFKTLLHGVFFCPSCGGDRQYARKQGRRWFTLFFIPVIPLKLVGEEFIECETCHSGFKPTVLTMPTTAALSENLVAATREAIVWLLRSGAGSPAAMATAIEVLSSSAGRPWSEQELVADVAALPVDGLPGRLAGLAGALNEHGKESLLGGCGRVAAAEGNGQLADDARVLLDQIAAGLGMTAAHARGVIAQAVEQAGI